MKRHFLHGLLFVFSPHEKKKTIKEFERILSCEFDFRGEDEDKVSLWIGYSLGFQFSIVSDKTDEIYSFSFASELIFESDTPYFNIEFHFIDLLHSNGFAKVMTNKEFGDYLDEKAKR